MIFKMIESNGSTDLCIHYHSSSSSSPFFLKWWYISIIRSEEEKNNINNCTKGVSGMSEDTLKVRSQEQSFSTSRGFYFSGNKRSSGALKISICIEGTTTHDMVNRLEELATAAQQKAREIVEEQIAPQQIRMNDEMTSTYLNTWMDLCNQNRENPQSAGDSLPESEQ